jgi:transcriptional regulator with XRE-family HTH domain
MPARMPDPLDVMVGARIRVFRIHRKISQTDLADQIGVTFQQVQKYEKGTNRIGASRLSRIAAVLGISVGELFESPGEKSGDSSLLFRLLAEPGALRVLKAYTRTSDARVRHAIAELIEGIADKQPAKKSSTKSSILRLPTGKRGGHGRRTARTRE